MKKTMHTWLRLCTMLLFVCGIGSKAAAQQPVRCYTTEQHAIRMAQDPTLESPEAFEEWMQEAKANMEQSKIVGGVYQIPVVVHVIHSGEAVGTGSNVSQAAIQSQIDVLNEDYRRMMGSNGWNTHPDGADTQIEFCLARRRPDGSAFAAGQPGVNRIPYSSITSTPPPYSTGFIDATIKPWTYNNGTATATRGWDPNKYMNIWLCDISDGILGYAQFPESPLGGMGCGSQSVATDGVVFLYSSIGKSSVTGFPAPYNEGRTATHEIGHWLGLRHIWGDGGCNVDDYCNDTPEAATMNYGCPHGINSCTAAPDAGVDMVENYMDYTDDMCMNIFTNDQKARMRTVLESSPLRVSLINSDACTPPNASDASVTDIFNPKGDNCAGAITPSVQLRNRGSSTLTSATVSYKIDNGAATAFSWTGSLAPGASATVALPAFTATLGVHAIKAYSTLPNGSIDPATTYDTSGVSFVVSNGIQPNYTQDFNNPVFPPDIKWTVDNPNGDCYEWIGATGISSTGVFSNNIAQLPFYGNPNTSQNENLITPVFILPCNASAATLQFKVAYRKRISGSSDRLIVEISQDCGSTWTATGYNKQGTTLATNGTLTGSSEYFPTVATDWRTETINLSSFVGATSKNIRFRFRGTANSGNNVFIDDIVYSATTPGEINVVQNGTDILDGGAFSFGSVTAGTTATATFTIQNTGSSSLTITPPATVTGTGFALSGTFGATTIPAGGTTTFTMAFSPSAAGPYTGNISFTTNDCDEGTYDFTLSGTGFASAPTADFSAVPATVCAGQQVAFTNLSTNATSYTWTFPASATPASSTAANPVVIFNTAGTYPVTLVATNSYGTDTETKTGYITVIAGVGAALPLTEGFTSATFPPAGWSIVNPDGSTTWTRSTAAGHTPTTGNSMLFNNYSVDDVGHSDEVRIKPLSFLGLSAAQLTFDVAYAPRDADYYSDALEVLVSTDCGNTFTSVYLKGNMTLATATATTSQFTPTSSQWRTETVSLTPYINEGNIVVAFRNLAGYGNRLFVDNINISGTAVTTAPTPNFTATPTAICAGETVTFTNTTTGGATSYNWTFPGGTPATSTAENPVVTYATAGVYNVSLQASNGSGSNTSTHSNMITVNAIPAAPSITAGGPISFCTGGSVVLTSSAVSGNTWSTGPITQAITVSAAGTYSVTTTANGCTSASSAPVAVTTLTPPATPTITPGGPTTFCSGGSVTLTSSSATGNTWSTGATTQSITVSASGTYTVTVGSGSCTATSAGITVTVTPLPATPTITPGGPTTFCSGGSVTLTSSSATGNTWSTGATTQSITVSASGTYTVTVSNGTCSATSAGTSVTVNPLPATPTITAGGPTTFCSGGDVTLTSSSATGNTWSTGATTQSITVSASGTYTVTVSNGTCSATSAGTSVTVNPLPATPTITAGGPTTFCSGGSVTLTSSSATGNTWSTGATTQSITVSASGTYTVTVSDGTCSVTSAGTSVTVNPLPATPTISAGGPTTFCSGGDVTLTSSSATGNMWSTGATTQSITVSASGTYTVTVSNGTCSATSAGTSVTVNPLPATPTITAGGPTTFCSGGDVTLTSSSATGNMWSTGATTQSITVSASGTYTVTVSNGTCSATSAGTSVTVNPLPATPTITAGGPTTFCSGGDVTLTSSSATGNMWSTGATTQSITVSASGTYTVTVSNGTCSATSAGTWVTVNTTPVITAGTITNPSVCAASNGSIQVTGSGTGDLSWTGTASGSMSGVTLPATISGLTAGSYTITFTGASGCASNTLSQGLNDPSAPATPTIAADGPTTFCSGGSVTLTSSSATGDTWSGGETTQSVTVSVAGSYAVTFTDGSGCSATSSATIITVNATPSIAVGTVTDPVTCGTATGSIQVTGSGTGDLAWTGTASGSMTGITLPATASTLAAGSYSFTFTSGAGCVSNTISQALNDPSAPAAPTITADGPTTFCSGESVTLTSSSATGNMWSTGATTQSITVSAAGNYAVTFTNGGGCSSTSAATTITVNAEPVVSFGALSTMCVYNSPMTLTQGSPVGGAYSGNGVGGGQFDPAVAGLGTSMLQYVYTDGNGCSGTATATILVDACAGIEESAAANIHVFPNPSSGIFTIDAGTVLINEVTVYDNAGRLVQTIKGSGKPVADIDLTKMADGMYTLQIMTLGAAHRIPVVINK